MTDTFHVKIPGVLATIQDLGRMGYGQYGIPVSGAMDRTSFQIANRLVGNAPGDAGLEITLYGLKVETLRSVRIAITGGDMNPTLNGEALPMWQTLDLLGYWVKAEGQAEPKMASTQTAVLSDLLTAGLSHRCSWRAELLSCNGGKP